MMLTYIWNRCDTLIPIQETRLEDSLTGQSQAYRRLHDLNLTLANFMKSDLSERECKAGYNHQPRLNPVKRKCGDDFTLSRTTIDDVVLTHGDYHVQYQPLDFCLFFDDNTTLHAEICRIDVTDKFKLVVQTHASHLQNVHVTPIIYGHGSWL